MNHPGSSFVVMSKPRINYMDVSPAVMRTMLTMSGHVKKAGLDARLVLLTDLRVSQINGCAFCVDMHHKELIAMGETPERLALLAVWREAHQTFTPREQIALDWAEAVTLLGPRGVGDEVYEAALREFGEATLVELTMSVVKINSWNRLNVAFRTPPGVFKAPAL